MRLCCLVARRGILDLLRCPSRLERPPAGIPHPAPALAVVQVSSGAVPRLSLVLTEAPEKVGGLSANPGAELNRSFPNKLRNLEGTPASAPQGFGTCLERYVGGAESDPQAELAAALLFLSAYHFW